MMPTLEKHLINNTVVFGLGDFIYDPKILSLIRNEEPVIYNILIKDNLTAIPAFWQYTPEQKVAYLADYLEPFVMLLHAESVPAEIKKYTTLVGRKEHILKNIVYKKEFNKEFRKKLTGYENIYETPWYQKAFVNMLEALELEPTREGYIQGLRYDTVTPAYYIKDKIKCLDPT